MAESVIKLDNISVFQGPTLVLDHIDLEVQKGELVYLIGKTGSGKSSLLKILYGDLPVANGTAMVADYNLTKLNVKNTPLLRRSLGIIFQDFQLLTDRSVESNLSFVLSATGWNDKIKIKNRIEEVLTMVDLNTKGFKMPHELSGGEQQRIVIARALLNEPKLILADEPTGNLDPETANEVIDLITKLNKELHTAIVMATHNYGLIKKFPGRVIKCEGGKIRELDSASLNSSN